MNATCPGSTELRARFCSTRHAAQSSPHENKELTSRILRREVASEVFDLDFVHHEFQLLADSRPARRLRLPPEQTKVCVTPDHSVLDAVCDGGAVTWGRVDGQLDPLRLAQALMARLAGFSNHSKQATEATRMHAR